MQALEEPSSPRIEDEATHLSAEMFDGVPLDESLFDEVARDPQFEVEAPPERAVTEAVRRAVFEGKVAAARAKEKQVDLGRFPGWQLRFVGLYGIVIMIGAALMGLSNTVVIIMAALDKRVGLEHGLGLLALAAFQAVVYFVLFRMGRGLVESQRSAVKGLIVLYVVFVAGGVIGHLADRESTVIIAIYVGLISVLLLPPILVAYTSWSDFHETND